MNKHEQKLKNMSDWQKFFKNELEKLLKQIRNEERIKIAREAILYFTGPDEDGNPPLLKSVDDRTMFRIYFNRIITKAKGDPQ